MTASLGLEEARIAHALTAGAMHGEAAKASLLTKCSTDGDFGTGIVIRKYS